MTSMKPEVIRYKHIRNVDESKNNLESMAKNKFGDKWLGFLKETTFIHSEGFIIRKVEPIEGSPAKEFRKAIEEAGLVGKNLFNDADHENQDAILGQDASSEVSE